MILDPQSNPSRPLDTARTDAFGDRVLAALNEASVLLMMSIGHRTGLFETMSRLEPSTSEEIAAAAGLDERYVREWLGALAVGRVIDVDDLGRFSLPPEHAALLTAAGEADLGVFAGYIPVLGSVEDDIIRCFREGGGVPYSRFDRFHELMAEDSGQTVLPALHSHILPLVSGLRERLGQGIDIADLGCGRGRALLDLASHFPASAFVGYDLSSEAIAHATAQAEAQGLTNIRFEVRDLSDFDVTAEPHAFDLVTTFDAVHDQAKPANLLRGIRRSLRPSGVYLMQDIHAHSHLHGNMDHPVGPFLYTVSCMHCMTVSLAQGGDGLGTMWGRERATKMLHEAGFSKVEIHQLDHDFQNDYYVVRP
ncbi:MAG: methyltransferase domain-containing protein [Gemmatimonas sp.]|nr:methyltransferase domain-containing protein [Gemmatimonas sp.]